MKTKNIVLLVLPFLLLGCSNSQTGLTIEQGQALVDTFSHPTPTSYTVNGKIHMVGLIPDEDNNGNLVVDAYKTYKEDIKTVSPYDNKVNWGITENLGEGYLSASYYLYAPLKLSSYGFYKTKIDAKGNETIDANYCVYGYMKSILIYADSLSKLILSEVDLNGEKGLMFSTYNSSTFLTIHNFNWETANYVGRINAEYIYNSQGLLVSEKVWSNTYTPEKINEPNVLYLESSYTYNF